MMSSVLDCWNYLNIVVTTESQSQIRVRRNSSSLQKFTVIIVYYVLEIGVWSVQDLKKRASTTNKIESTK